jgi:hypothetical protein
MSLCELYEVQEEEHCGTFGVFIFLSVDIRDLRRSFEM